MRDPTPADAGRRTPRRGPRKPTFYSIGDVCRMFGIKPHVLRYWETQFEELSPTKNRAGNRVYQARDVELIALIQRLVHEERYTIEGARQRIQELREQGGEEESSVEALRSAFLRSLHSELEAVMDLLGPESR